MNRPSPGAGRLASGVLACTLLLARAAAAATSGVLDPAFGSGGTATTAVGSGDDFAYAAAVQADGGIVVAGYSTTTSSPDNMSVVRYTPAGALDPSFNGTGKSIISFGSDVDRVQAVAISPVDQRIVLAGFNRTGGNDDFAIVRLTTSGALDTTFNATGKVLISTATNDDAAAAVAVQPDGKVVAAGYALGANRDVAVVRLNANGTADTSFNTTGKLVFGVGTSNDEASAIALQADGRILVAGYAADGTQFDMMVARLTSTGALDTTFGNGGKVRIAFGTGNEYATGIALQTDGKIIVGGYARVGTTWNFAVARLMPTGALDTSFDGDGLVTTAIGTSSKANAVAFANGHIVLGGFAQVNGNDDFALVRYGVNGSVDSWFGGGPITLAFGSAADTGRAVAVQSDRKVILAGSMRSVNDDNFAIARWLVDDCGNGQLDETEECDGSALANGGCCSSCHLLAAGAVCRGAADECDFDEACDGADGDCPPDVRKPDADDDLVCDEFDICPLDPDPGQEDNDADGLGDACDPCTNGPNAAKARMRLTNYATAPGDDKFALDATIRFPAPLDLHPDEQGIRVIVQDALGSVLADANIPGGPAWSLSRTGTTWSWRSPTLVDGWVNSVRLKSTFVRPDTVAVTIGGARGAFAAPRPALPLSAIVVLDAPTAASGLCGYLVFPDPGPPYPYCRFSPTGSTLDCK